MVAGQDLLTHWEGEPVEVWRTIWSVPHLEIHSTLNSTNDRAKALAQENGQPWSLILAERQTGGRGRGGNRWFSPPGQGLWFTLLLPSRSQDWDSLLPIRVGLGVAEAADGVLSSAGAQEVTLRLKWPNDLLLEGKKVGGILCEKAGSGLVLVGVGVNVEVPREGFPPHLERVAGSLEGCVDGGISKGHLLGRILGALRTVLVAEGEELEMAELSEYAARDALLGRRVESELAGFGVARGLTPQGGLILEGEDGNRKEVRAGSVVPTADPLR